MTGWTLLKFVVLGVIGFVLFCIIDDRVFTRKLRRKTGWSRSRFIAAFELKGVDPRDAGVVHDFFQQWWDVRDYLVSPQDDLEKDYHFASIEYYESFTSILEQCSLELPPERIRLQWPGGPLQTVEDVVLWVDWVRHQQSPQTRDEPQLLTPPRLFPYF